MKTEENKLNKYWLKVVFVNKNYPDWILNISAINAEAALSFIAPDTAEIDAVTLRLLEKNYKTGSWVAKIENE